MPDPLPNEFDSWTDIDRHLALGPAARMVPDLYHRLSTSSTPVSHDHLARPAGNTSTAQEFRASSCEEEGSMPHLVATTNLAALQHLGLNHQDLDYHRFEARQHIAYILFATLRLAEQLAKYEDPDTIS